MFTKKEIRRRIEAVRNTQKITRSMKLVAAARLKGAQVRALADRPYTSAMHGVTMRLSRRLGREAPMLWRRPRSLECVDLIVITSDRGLCGGFNENLLRAVEEGILEHLTHNMSVRSYVIGRQGSKWLLLSSLLYQYIVCAKHSQKVTPSAMNLTSQKAKIIDTSFRS